MSIPDPTMYTTPIAFYPVAGVTSAPSISGGFVLPPPSSPVQPDIKEIEKRMVADIKRQSGAHERIKEEDLKKRKIQQTIDFSARAFGANKHDLDYFDSGSTYYDTKNADQYVRVAVDFVEKIHQHYGEQESSAQLNDKITNLESRLDDAHSQAASANTEKNRAVLELSAQETKVQAVVDAAKKVERLQKNVVVGRLKDNIEQAASHARRGVKKQSGDFIDKIVEIVNEEYQKL